MVDTNNVTIKKDTSVDVNKSNNLISKLFSTIGNIPRNTFNTINIFKNKKPKKLNKVKRACVRKNSSVLRSNTNTFKVGISAALNSAEITELNNLKAYYINILNKTTSSSMLKRLITSLRKNVLSSKIPNGKSFISEIIRESNVNKLTNNNIIANECN